MLPNLFPNRSGFVRTFWDFPGPIDGQEWQTTAVLARRYRILWDAVLVPEEASNLSSR